jgi:hypothetical protein
VGFNVTSPELTRDICTYLLRQCGGHAYSTLAFIEYFTKNIKARQHVQSMETLVRFFCGPVFVESPCYTKVRRRCFGQLTEQCFLEAAVRVLRCQATARDRDALNRLGWWNAETNDFVSVFLVNTCLSSADIKAEDVIYLERSKDGEPSDEMCRLNTERVIIAGLKAMEDSDFEVPRERSRYDVRKEDALSFNWGYRARCRVPNAHLHFQERAALGRVNFYLNGSADTAIEVLRNATQSAEPRSETTDAQSQDIDEHLARFHRDKYAWKRFALFNFALSTDVVLPRDETVHDKVYTYVHKTNTLYRGHVPIKQNVVTRRASGSPPLLSPPGVGQTNRYSTVARAGPGLRRFMATCFRRI